MTLFCGAAPGAAFGLLGGAFLGVLIGLADQAVVAFRASRRPEPART